MWNQDRPSLTSIGPLKTICRRANRLSNPGPVGSIASGVTNGNLYSAPDFPWLLNDLCLEFNLKLQILIAILVAISKTFAKISYIMITLTLINGVIFGSEDYCLSKTFGCGNILWQIWASWWWCWSHAMEPGRRLAIVYYGASNYVTDIPGSRGSPMVKISLLVGSSRF